MKGASELKTEIANFIMLFGCEPADGVGGATEFVNDIINLMKDSFDAETGTVLLPDALNMVVSSDAIFETSSSNLS